MSDADSSSGKIAGLVINQNDRKATLACLAALAETDHTPLTVYLLANGCLANERIDPGELERFPMPVIEVVAEEVLTRAAGYNLLIRKALQDRPDWLWFLDDVVAFQPSALTTQLRAAQNHSLMVVGALGVNSDLLVQSSGGFFSGRLDGQLREGDPAPRKQSGSVAMVAWVALPGMLVSADLFRVLRGFSVRFYDFFETADFCWRAKELGVKTGLAEQVQLRLADRPYRLLTSYFQGRNPLLFLYLRYRGLARWNRVLGHLWGQGLTLGWHLYQTGSKDKLKNWLAGVADGLRLLAFTTSPSRTS